MPSERLNELRRQRDAVQAHLNWLDAEITRESGADEPTTPAKIPPPAPAAEISTPPAQTEYQPDPVSAAADARKGCLIWFLALLLLGLALITAIYFWRYRDHPLLFAPEAESVRTEALLRSA